MAIRIIKKFAAATIPTFLFAVLFVIGCGGDGSEPSNPVTPDVPTNEPVVQIIYGTMTDTRDNKKYRTVEIGNRVWMADNIDHRTASSMCYDNDESNCDKYGALYTWAAALDLDLHYDTTYWSGDFGKPDLHHQGVCPKNWRIPNDLDWDDLMTAVGDSVTAGKKLKSASGWYGGGNGTNDFGFSALPGGFFDYSVSEDFINIGRNGFWWSVSNNNRVFAYYHGISYDRDYRGSGQDRKLYGLSVRCVTDI